MKLRVSKDLHARMRARADAIGVDLSELVRRCVSYRERQGGVALSWQKCNATRADSTVITLSSNVDSRAIRAAVTWALDRTETQATPLDIEDVEVEYVK